MSLVFGTKNTAQQHSDIAAQAFSCSELLSENGPSHRIASLLGEGSGKDLFDHFLWSPGDDDEATKDSDLSSSHCYRHRHLKMAPARSWISRTMTTSLGILTLRLTHRRSLAPTRLDLITGP